MIFVARKILLMSALAAMAPMQAVASNGIDAMVPVHQFIDGFNKGDLKWAIAACTDKASVIDDFSPHVWQGCEDWAQDFEEVVKKEGIAETRIVMEKPRHVDVTGDRAYVVAPVALIHKVKGEPKELPGMFTVSLHKEAGGWHITGWAWADL